MHNIWYLTDMSTLPLWKVILWTFWIDDIFWWHSSRINPNHLIDIIQFIWLQSILFHQKRIQEICSHFVVMSLHRESHSVIGQHQVQHFTFSLIKMNRFDCYCYYSSGTNTCTGDATTDAHQYTLRHQQTHPSQTHQNRIYAAHICLLGLYDSAYLPMYMLVYARKFIESGRTTTKVKRCEYVCGSRARQQAIIF